MAQPPPPPPPTPQGEMTQPPSPPQEEAAQPPSLQQREAPPPAPPPPQQGETAQPPSPLQEAAAQPPPPPPQEEEAQPPPSPPPPPPPQQGEMAQPPSERPEKAIQLAVVQPKHPEREKCIAAVSLVFIFLTGLTITIIWLPLLPKKLEYSVQRASIGGYNLTSDGHLSANFSFIVRANNPHKSGFSFYYDKIDATASYKGGELFSVNNTIQPFNQPRRNATDLTMNLTARDYKVVNESMAKFLRIERGIGVLNLGLKIKAKMSLKLGVLKVIHRTLKVSCGPLKLPFSSSSRVFETVLCDADMGE